MFDVGKAKPTIVRSSNITTTFKDVAGLFEAKEEVKLFGLFTERHLSLSVCVCQMPAKKHCISIGSLS